MFSDFLYCIFDQVIPTKFSSLYNFRKAAFFHPHSLKMQNRKGKKNSNLFPNAFVPGFYFINWLHLLLGITKKSFIPIQLPEKFVFSTHTRKVYTKRKKNPTFFKILCSRILFQKFISFGIRPDIKSNQFVKKNPRTKHFEKIDFRS